MSPTFAAAFWGFVGGGALVLGAAVGFYVKVPSRVVAGVMAFSSPAAEPAVVRRHRTNEDNDWKFLASVNPWFLFLSGELSFQDSGVPIDVPFDSIWKQLHMALMVDLEVQ
jgi:hypothetical protein